MKDTEILIASKNYCESLIKQNICNDLPFHNWQHTLDVYQNARKLGKLENLNYEDMLVVSIAACFHDIGQINGPSDHENRSASCAKKFLQSLDVRQDIIEEVGTKIKLPSVEIRGILELTDNSSNGIENIRNSLQGFEKTEQNSVKILYIGAPKYRIRVTASDFKSAEKTLKPILEDIQKNIEKNKGIFKFTREESKKTGEG